MNLYVFSHNKKILSVFTAIEKSRNDAVCFLPPNEFLKTAKRTRQPAFFYLDAAAFGEKKVLTLLASFKTSRNVLIGIIDAARAVKDVALLFAQGAADYLGPELCREGVKPARLARVLFLTGKTAAVPLTKQPDGEGNEAASAVPPAKKWEEITPGTEYRFFMLFIELDGYRNISQRVNEASVDRLLEYFQRSVESHIRARNGRLWIWNDFGGIALFPVTSKISSLVIACMRLMLSRRILSVDQNEHKLLFSYRLVLYPGSTVYRERGKTGRIISDAVNSLSHIGMKYAKPGSFYISEEFHDKLSPEMQNCFMDAGTYECTRLFKMRLPARY